MSEEIGKPGPGAWEATDFKSLTGEFPAFIQGLPQAQLPFEGMTGWLLQSEHGQLVFFAAETDLVVPQHAHGEQWGIVVDGQVDLTIGGESRTYRKGDTFYIPAGVSHGGLVHAGFRSVEFFADRERYRVK